MICLFIWVMQIVHQNGLTAVADLEFPLINEELEQQKAEEILKNKETSHFSTYLVPSARNYSKMCGGDNQKAIEHIQDLANKLSDDQLVLYNNHVKCLCDGAFYSQLMQMKDGYIDGHDGQWIMQPEELEETMRVYWRNGFQIHVHTNGDLGMQKLLEVVETLNKESPRENHRVTVEHAGYFTEDQADRIAQLGLLVSAAPYYFYTLADKYSEDGLGTARAQAMVPMKWLFDRGVVTAFHSDFTMAPSAPLLLAWSAITRVTADGNTYREDLRVTPYQGMLAITKNAAIILGTDDIMGTIEGGKLANFTILEQNPLAVEPIDIKDIKIYASVYKGKMYTTSKTRA